MDWTVVAGYLCGRTEVNHANGIVGAGGSDWKRVRNTSTPSALTHLVKSTNISMFIHCPDRTSEGTFLTASFHVKKPLLFCPHETHSPTLAVHGSAFQFERLTPTFVYMRANKLSHITKNYL
jgi:hypothetical protein